MKMKMKVKFSHVIIVLIKFFRSSPFKKTKFLFELIFLRNATRIKFIYIIYI